MNILIATPSFPVPCKKVYDGKFVFSEAVAYVENGADVIIVTPHMPGTPIREQIDKGIMVHRFRYFLPESLQLAKRPGSPVYRQRNFLGLLQIPVLCLLFVLNILKHSYKADIVHAEWTVTALLSLPAKWFFGKKIVVTARGSDVRILPPWVNRFIHNQVDAAIDCFGPQPWNEVYKRSFPANYIRLPLLVETGVPSQMPEDMKEPIAEKNDTFIILYIGRFDPIKVRGNSLPIFDLILACRELKRRDRSLHLFYIGDGDQSIKRQMEQLIEQENMQDQITILGPKIEVLEYINCCHLGVGGIAFNAVSQEFTTNGKAQVLMDNEDNRGTPWSHGANVLLVKPGDLRDLCDKLMWAMDHREAIERMGHAAKEELKSYMINTKCGGRQYINEFRKLIDG